MTGSSYPVQLAFEGFVQKQLNSNEGHLSVPASEIPSTWTCLYRITEGSCDSTSDTVKWRGQSGSSSYCVDVTYNGQTTCMLAVDLHIQQPNPGSYYCDSSGGVSVQLMFGGMLIHPFIHKKLYCCFVGEKLPLWLIFVVYDNKIPPPINK